MVKMYFSSDKPKFKIDYVSSRKASDREVQRSKRIYCFNFQQELIDECSSTDNNFWKAIGKVGVGQKLKRRIPMEVVLDDGSVSSETAAVLEKMEARLFFSFKL